MKLTVNTFVTLDGVMQAPGGPSEDADGGFERGGWLIPYADEGMGSVVEGWFAKADAVLLGRTTYRMMESHWPLLDDDGSHTWRALNAGRKYVVSTTMSDADATWGDTTVVKGDIVEEIRRLKAQPGGEIQVHGSWRLIQTLHEAGLVDEYRLLVFPVSVGGGKRLFAEGSLPSGFEVSDTSITDAGAQAMTLTPTPFQQASVAVEEGQEVTVPAS